MNNNSDDVHDDPTPHPEKIDSVADVTPGSLDIGTAGAKAFGLRDLPATWVPPFRVLAARRPDLYLEDSLVSEVSHLLGTLEGPPDYVAVRSSAVAESLAERGRLHTYVVQTNTDAVAAAARQIAEHAQEVGVDDLALLIQTFVPPEARGHLANERRVSQKESDWLVELDHPYYLAARIKASRNRDQPTELLRGFGEFPMRALESLASILTKSNCRYHIEWVSDGQRVWVVQADPEERVSAPAPFSLWLDSHPPTGGLPFTSDLLISVSDSDRGWRKAENVRGFVAAGVPAGDVFVLEDEQTVRRLADGEVSAELRAELHRFCSGPIVARTDVGVAQGIEGLLLPRSDNLQSLEEVEEFLLMAGQQLHDQAMDGHLAFLFHRFIAARSGAFAYAAPDLLRVRIDASWGVPDTLLFHPYDTFEVDLADIDRIQAALRCKSRYVDVDERGHWVERDAGWGWDWKASLERSEIQQIAVDAHRVAVEWGAAVAVMFFVGAPPASGQPEVLPWWVGRLDGGLQSERVPPPARSVIQTIRTNADVAAATHALSASLIEENDCMLLLRPTTQLLRDPVLLKEVAVLATQFDLPVMLEGSVLSHVFYLLRRAGVTVYVREPSEFTGRSLPLNKLVRDRVPEIVRSRSEDITVRHVTGDGLLDLLRLKAVEEAAELVYAKGEDEILDEIADVFEVLRSIANELGLSFEDVIVLANEKRDKRGGFVDGTVLIRTQTTSAGSAGDQTEAPAIAEPLGRVIPIWKEQAPLPPRLLVPFRGIGSDQVFRMQVEAEETGPRQRLEIRYVPEGIEITVLPLAPPRPSTDQLMLFAGE